MSGGHLTSDEWRRINEFADTPKHRRRPEQLLPEGSRSDAADAVDD